MKVVTALTGRRAATQLRILVGCLTALLCFCVPPSLLHAQNQSSAATAGQKQFESGQYSAAITTLKNAVAANPKDAAAQYWLGRACYEQKNFQDSADAREKAT